MVIFFPCGVVPILPSFMDCFRRNINTILEGIYLLLLRSPKFYATKHLPNPSKYRAANPCPHNLALPHPGHREGFNHGNFFPLANKTFTSTARCSIKMPLSERVTIGTGGQSNQPLVALFYDQITLIKTLSHTKHRDKKIPLSVNLMCEATLG